MNRRQSTNVKLVAIINSKNNDQDEERAVQDIESKAKIRLRRTSLYGGIIIAIYMHYFQHFTFAPHYILGGARTKIPKIKIGKSASESPFRMNESNPDHLKEPKKFESSIPPGAHSDQFRVVA